MTQKNKNTDLIQIGTGLFITFEGTEGSGKTTAIQGVYEALEHRGISCIITREPGGIPISEHIRELILADESEGMDPRTEALLYAASRRQHLVEKVKPALEKGYVVLCDRFLDSSLVYQGRARKIGIEAVYALNTFAIESYMPKRTYFLDLQPEEGLHRVAQRAEEVNRFDREDIEFHRNVYAGYCELLEQYSARIHRIDASQSKEAVVNDILNDLENLEEFKSFISKEHMN